MTRARQGPAGSGPDLGAVHLSGETLSLDLRGTGADTILIGIDVRTRPGLWVGGGWQRQWLGDGNPAAFDPRPSFRRLASDDLEVFA